MKPIKAENLTRRLGKLEREVRALRKAVTTRTETLPAQFAALEMLAGGTRCALPIATIREVVAAPWCEPLPDSVPWVLGTFCYGSEVVPVVDLGYRLVGRPSAQAATDLVVIVHTPVLTGVRITAVGDVVDLAAADVSTSAVESSAGPLVLGALPGRGGGTLHVLAASLLAEELVEGGESSGRD